MSQSDHHDVPAAPTLAQATAYWAKLGCVSFGGPAGQIAMMHRELVEQRRWVSEQRFLHALNYCMVLPGPEAQQLATYIGWLMHGRWGGIVAGGLFVLPSFFVLAGLSWLYMVLGPAVTTQALQGVKPAVVAIVAFAVWRIGSKVLDRLELWVVTLSAFAAILILQVPYPLIVLAAALFGWLARQRLGLRRGEGQVKREKHRPALIDDHTPTPAHAEFSKAASLRVLLTGVLVWAAALFTVGAFDPLLLQLARFFTQAALLTFGGAYAVMPYVFQGAVEHYHWLTAPQMLDGLALGETTPGPLIMVVEFIGFIAGWNHSATAGWTGGLTGAVVAVFFTFLPSFIFILAGGPLVEHTRKAFGLDGPLKAVNAAVVGTMLYLAVFLAGHVFWPSGLGAGVAVWPMLLALGAWWVLYRQKLGMISVILICGLLGWIEPMLQQWIATVV